MAGGPAGAFSSDISEGSPLTTIHTFASGSFGNAALVSRGATHILLDAGISARRITAALSELGLSPQDLSAVCITHSHSDHISGLATIAKRWDVPILATAPCGRQLSYRIAGLEAKLRPIGPGGGFPIGEITVTAFPTSHDAPGSCGFRFDEAGILTDSGYVTEEAEETLSGAALLLLEANHDVELLQNGPYPYYLKERILGGQGHLSNEAAAAFAVEMARRGTEEIVLAHLSAENNTAERALSAVGRALAEAGFDLPLEAAPRNGLSRRYGREGAVCSE